MGRELPNSTVTALPPRFRSITVLWQDGGLHPAPALGNPPDDAITLSHVTSLCLYSSVSIYDIQLAQEERKVGLKSVFSLLGPGILANLERLDIMLAPADAADFSVLKACRHLRILSVGPLVGDACSPLGILNAMMPEESFPR